MNTIKTILKFIFVTQFQTTGLVFFMYILSCLPLIVIFGISPEPDILYNAIGFGGTVGMVIVSTFATRSLYGRQLSQIKKISNMEKQSKKLRRMGIEEFVKRTKSNLVHKSSRGNELYTSTKIIAKKPVSFLIYQDTSTNRKYIKYVPNEFTDADEAQAWSLSMDLNNYKKMTIEA